MTSKRHSFGVRDTRTLQVFPPRHLLSEPLNHFFSGKNGKDLSELCDRFPKYWGIYVLGGVLRNLLLKQLCETSIVNADVDIVVSGATSTAELHSLLQKSYLRQNEFGGVKCQISDPGILFDVWRIEDHATQRGAPPPHTIKQLLRHNLLDIDAVLWDIRTGYLYDYGCLDAIRRQRIDLLGEQGISQDFAAAQVVHLLIVWFKTGFELSDEAFVFVRESCNSDEVRSEISRILQRKWPTATSELERSLNELLEENVQLWPRPMTR
jgi:hypothetical protein